MKIDSEVKNFKSDCLGLFPPYVLKHKMLIEKEFSDFYGYQATEPVFDEMTHEERESTRRIREFARLNKFLPKLRKLGFSPMFPLANMPAMICPKDSAYEWLTFRSKVWWDFVVDVRNCLATEVGELGIENVNQLGVNYCLAAPFSSMIHRSSAYRPDDSHYDRDELLWCGQLTAERQWTLYRNQLLDDCAPRLKPGTNPGYPWTTVTGEAYKREDVIFGNEAHRETQGLTYHLDYYDIKRGWAEDHENGSTKVFLEQWEMRKSWNDPEKIVDFFDRGIITVNSMAYRWNNPDPCLNEGKWDNPDSLYCKNRTCSVELKEGSFMTFDLDNKKYTQMIHAKTGHTGALLRRRAMFPSNNAQAHLYGNLLSKLLVQQMEHGLSGLPADRPELKTKVRMFYERLSDTHDIEILSIDRKNAEKFIASNMDRFLLLMDPSVAEYLQFTATAVMPSNQGLRVCHQSYCSAVWYTTYFHLVLGNYECFKIILDTCGIVGEVRKAAFEKLYDALYFGDVCTEFAPNFFACVFAGTDDIMVPVAFPKGFKKIDQSRKMEERLVTGGFVANASGFGMKMDQGSLSVNEGNQLGRVFHPEHPGDGDHDAFVTKIKIASAGQYTELITDLMKKHHLGSLAGYEGAERQFFTRLSKDGILVEDIFNEFSPSERILYGDYVDVSTLGKSHRLPPDALSVFKRMLDSTIYQGRKYGKDDQTNQLLDRKYHEGLDFLNSLKFK